MVLRALENLKPNVPKEKTVNLQTIPKKSGSTILDNWSNVGTKGRKTIENLGPKEGPSFGERMQETQLETAQIIIK